MAIAPRPLLVVSVGSDWTTTTPRVELPFLLRAYHVVGAPAALDSAHFEDEEHDLGPSKRRSVYAFLGTTFSLPQPVGEQVPLPHERLLVFPVARRHPPSAVENAEQARSVLTSLQR